MAVIEESNLMLLQTVAIVITLLVFIYQIRVEKKAVQRETIHRCDSDYSAIVRMMIEKPEFNKIYDDIAKKMNDNVWIKFPKHEKMMYNYFELNYELFERAYILHYKDKWMDDETWEMWERWIEYISKHKMFSYVHNDVKDMFDHDFQNYISSILPTEQNKQYLNISEPVVTKEGITIYPDGTRVDSHGTIL